MERDSAGMAPMPTHCNRRPAIKSQMLVAIAHNSVPMVAIPSVIKTIAWRLKLSEIGPHKNCPKQNAIKKPDIAVFTNISSVDNAVFKKGIAGKYIAVINQQRVMSALQYQT